MRILLTLLLTIYSTTEILSRKNCPVTCGPPSLNTIVCVKITPAHSAPFYQQIYKCAAAQFRCYAADRLNVSIVRMTKCYQVTSPMTPIRRIKRDISNSIDEDKDTWPKYQEKCPTGCPARSVMVCARYGKGLYRSFLSDCYMRMYQCKHPEEKLELESRRACYAVAPVLDGLPRPEKSPMEQAQDHVLDYIDSRTDSNRKKIRIEPPPRPIVRTPKPTVDIPWLTRPRKTTKKTKKSKRPATRPKKSTLSTTTRPRETTKPDVRDPTTSETTTVYGSTAEERFTVQNDACNDFEDDETPIDIPDVCPSSTIDNILATKRKYMKVELHPDHVEEIAPVWTVWNNGTDVTTRSRADAGIVMGCEVYAGVDYSGNIIVNSLEDNDFIGFVFGYRSHRLFYLVTWKATTAKYWIGSPFVAIADAGLHIKLVNSSTGPGADLRNSIYNTKSVKDQVTLIWQDRAKQGWKHKQKYNWRLIHRPRIGLIRMKVFVGTELLVDTGNIYDSTIKGGRIGLFSFSQEDIAWTKMRSKCNDKIPSNVMTELPRDLQKISVLDSTYEF